jgi:hypothetical protein
MAGALLRFINMHGAAAKLPRITGGDSEVDRMRATGTDDAPVGDEHVDHGNLRMATCMAGFRSFQGISGSSAVTPIEEAQKKSPEKSAQDFSAPLSAMGDNEMML